MLVADVTGGSEGSASATSTPRPPIRRGSPRFRRPAGAGMAPSAPSKRRDEPAWEPLAGTALLERLRLSGRPRPAADPALPASLARRLDEGLGLVPHGDGGPQ